jgi:hypothetical protein
LGLRIRSIGDDRQLGPMFVALLFEKLELLMARDACEFKLPTMRLENL